MNSSLKLLVDSLKMRFLHVEHFKLDHTWYVAPKKIPCSLFRYVTEGAFEFSVNGVSYRAEKGQILYFPVFSTVHYRSDARHVSFITIRFEGEFSFLTHRLWSDVLKIPVELPVDTAELAPYFIEMVEISKHQNTLCQTLLLRARLLILVAKILEMLYKSEDIDWKSGVIDHRVESVIKVILSDQTSMPTINEMCEIAQVSETSLRRLFIQNTGLTPMKYLQHLKVDQAKKQLIESSNGISEIGYKLGFDDPNYFSRMFRRNTGLSPMTYRKLYSQS